MSATVRSRGVRVGGEALQQRERKRRGLPRARRGLTEDVAPCEKRRDRLALDRASAPRSPARRARRARGDRGRRRRTACRYSRPAFSSMLWPSRVPRLHVSVWRSRCQSQSVTLRRISVRKGRPLAPPPPSALNPAAMPSPTTVRHLRWTDLPKESVTAQLSRRLVTGERMMLAQVYLNKGCIVPQALARERADHLDRGGRAQVLDR